MSVCVRVSQRIAVMREHVCMYLHICMCVCTPWGTVPERERARALKMSSLSAQPACHKSRTYSVKLFADVTHENAQAPSVLLIHYCVWENSRNTQIPFQSVPLFSNGCMRFGFSLAPFSPPFFSTTFLLSISLPVKVFFGCDFDVFLHCLSLSLFSFLQLFILFPTFSLCCFLMFLLLAESKVQKT